MQILRKKSCRFGQILLANSNEPFSSANIAIALSGSREIALRTSRHMTLPLPSYMACFHVHDRRAERKPDGLLLHCKIHGIRKEHSTQIEFSGDCRNSAASGHSSTYLRTHTHTKHGSFSRVVIWKQKRAIVTHIT